MRLEPLAPEHRDGLLGRRRATRDLGVLVVQRRRERGGVRRWFKRCIDRRQRRRRPLRHDPAGDRRSPWAAPASAPVREHDRGLEIGWTWLTPAAWGTGANTEAKFLQLDTRSRRSAASASTSTPTRTTRAPARRSRSCRRKFEGVWRNYSIRETDGSKVSSAFYSVIDDEWPTVRANLIGRIARARRT